MPGTTTVTTPPRGVVGSTNPKDPNYNPYINHPGGFDLQNDKAAIHQMYGPQSGGGYYFGGDDPFQGEGGPTGIYDFDFSDKQALKSLFSNLNRINLKDPRLMGGGSGGGSEALEGNMDPNRFISLNPYLDQNVTSFRYGGVVKKKDPTKVNYSHGGYHDPYSQYSQDMYKFYRETGNKSPIHGKNHYQLAYEEEKKRREDIKYRRGLGRKDTKMSDEEWAKSSDNPDNLKHGWEEGYDQWYTVPESQKNAERGQIRIERDVMARNPYYEQASGMYDPYAVPQYFLGGLVKNIMGGAANVFQAIADPIGDLIRPVFDAAGNLVEGVADVFTGGDTPDFNIQDRPLPERDPVKKREITVQQAPQPIPVKGTVNVRQKDKSPGQLRQGDFVGNKPNPFVTENVQDELDYAQEGMRMPEVGMQMTNPLSEPEVYSHGGHFTRQANEAIALNQLSGIVANTTNRNRMVMAKGGEFKPHMMYDPKTGKGYKANVVEDHNRMNKMGYTHKKPKAAKGKKIKSYTNGGRL
tara:strand:+ start:1564 stop:3132 length:1569 start_codon:yes stop_codon:yes gene_type:complete